MVNGMGNNMCGMVRYSITMVQYNYGTVSLIIMVQYMAWYGIVWYGMVQYSIVWYSIVQYSMITGVFMHFML